MTSDEETRRTRRAACWAALVEKYHLDASQPYAARDEDCSLTASNGSGGPA